MAKSANFQSLFYMIGEDRAATAFNAEKIYLIFINSPFGDAVMFDSHHFEDPVESRKVS
jgi:hypothetical protein